MNVLAIETATDVCSVAMACDGTVAGEVTVREPRRHAELLIPQIERLLAGGGWSVSSIDGIAVSAGPGSFTGLRIGVAAAKALAWSLERPVAAVPTLSALAWKAVAGKAVRNGERILAVLDARKGEVYRRFFDATGDDVTPVGDEGVLSPKSLLKEIGEGPVVLTGSTSQLGDHPVGQGTIRVLTGEIAWCTAGPVSVLGTRMIRSGDTADRASLEPHYIKEFEPKRRVSIT